MKICRLLVVLLFCAGLGAADALACGDKFLVSGSGGPMQMQLLTDPARILVYGGEGLDSGVPLNPQLEGLNRTLADAGHTVWLVRDTDDFHSMLEGAEVELVIMEVSDVKTLKSEINATSPGTAILPYLNVPTRTQSKSARKEFGYVLAIPSGAAKVLNVVAKTIAGK